MPKRIEYTDLYKLPKFIEDARKVAVSRDFITNYARLLHANSEVVADLIVANKADSSTMTDDEFIALGGLVSTFMNNYLTSCGLNWYMAKEREAMGDFHGWYVRFVVDESVPLETALANYLDQSPYVLGEVK
jgi:hypothetical protein